MPKLQALFWMFAAVASETLCFDVFHAILESFSVFRERRVKEINLIKLPDSEPGENVDEIVSTIMSSVDDFTFTIERPENLSDGVR